MKSKILTPLNSTSHTKPISLTSPFYSPLLLSIFSLFSLSLALSHSLDFLYIYPGLAVYQAFPVSMHRSRFLWDASAEPRRAQAPETGFVSRICTDVLAPVLLSLSRKGCTRDAVLSYHCGDRRIRTFFFFFFSNIYSDISMYTIYSTNVTVHVQKSERGKREKE